MQITLEDQPYYFLLTSTDIISSNEIDNRESIELYFLQNGKEEKRIINFIPHERSNFVFYKPLEITLLEILDKDKISFDRFLKPDFNYKKGYYNYMNKSCYIAGFEKMQNKPNKFLSPCEITGMWELEFNHNSIKGLGSFGSIICLKENLNVIGINNKNVDKTNNIGNGIFIGKILNTLENDKKGVFPRYNISMYTGSLRFGLRHGKGSGFYADGELYEGEWVNDERDGYGIMYYSNGNIYIGEWKNNRREGKGEFYFCKGGIYKGEFNNNIIDGLGVLTVGNGTKSLEYVGTLRISSLDNPNFDVFHFLNS